MQGEKEDVHGKSTATLVLVSTFKTQQEVHRVLDLIDAATSPTFDVLLLEDPGALM